MCTFHLKQISLEISCFVHFKLKCTHFTEINFWALASSPSKVYLKTNDSVNLPVVGCCTGVFPAFGRVLGAMEVCIGSPSPCGVFTLLFGRSLGATEVPPIIFPWFALNWKQNSIHVYYISVITMKRSDCRLRPYWQPYLLAVVEVAFTWRDSDSVIGIGKFERFSGVEPCNIFHVLMKWNFMKWTCQESVFAFNHKFM